MRAVRIALSVITVFGAALLVQAIGAAHDLADPLDVTSVTLVSSEAEGDFVKETYRATLHYSGPPGARDFARVTATLAGAAGLSIPGFIQVVDGDVAFGTIRPGETIDGLDTFAIRRHRRIPLNPRQLRWQISARPDLVLPDDWAGKWRFRVTRTDPTSHRVDSTATITDTLGVREAIGFSLLPEFIRCRWHGDANSLEATCDGKARVAWCLTSGSAAFELHRDGESARGGGTVHVQQEGGCPVGTTDASDAIDITGTRLTQDADAEPLSPGLLPTFSVNPYFTILLSTGLDPSREPSNDDDCRHGGWRRFHRAWFHNETGCTSFLHARARRDQNGGL